MPEPDRVRGPGHPESRREAGLRSLRIWVTDTRRSGFDEECRRQSRIVAAADAVDPGFGAFLDDALADVEAKGDR